MLITAALDGTYGDLTFSTTPPEGVEFPDEFAAWAFMPPIEIGESVTATGLPDGTYVIVDDPVDDINTGTVPCTINFISPAAVDDLSVQNTSMVDVTATVMVMVALEGTFGDITFSTTPLPGEPFPENYYSVAVVQIPAGGTLTATGLPDGAGASATCNGITTTGNVPCTLYVGDDK